jgi:hypothetical protein
MIHYRDKRRSYRQIVKDRGTSASTLSIIITFTKLYGLATMSSSILRKIAVPPAIQFHILKILALQGYIKCPDRVGSGSIIIFLKLDYMV